jgi:hypothetical protein
MNTLLTRFQRNAGAWLVFTILLGAVPAFGQYEVLGPKSGKTIVSEQGAGYFWENPMNARRDDDESRTATPPLTQGQFSQMLKVSNFGFKLPAEAKIEGIEVLIVRKADVEGSIQDKRIVLLRNGQAVGTSLHTKDLWDGEWTAAFYGEAKESWGNTWKVSDINAPGFGIGIEVQCAGPIARPQIDEVFITIHYSYAGEYVRGYRTTTGKNTCSPVGG